MLNTNKFEQNTNKVRASLIFERILSGISHCPSPFLYPRRISSKLTFQILEPENHHYRFTGLDSPWERLREGQAKSFSVLRE